jgi:hypothetical protein
MELKLQDCPKVKFPWANNWFVYDDILVSHRYKFITAWDVSDPLNIRQIASRAMDWSSGPAGIGTAGVHDKSLFLYSNKEIRIVDVSDPADMKDAAFFPVDPPVLKMDVDKDGTVWALAENGAIGVFGMNGIFTEYRPADETLVKKEGRYHPDIKVLNNLVVAANQENGVLIFEIQADRMLKLLKHIKNGGELCRGTPIKPVNNNQAIICISFIGMVMIDLKTLKKSKILKGNSVEFTSTIIEYHPDKREIIACGSFNDNFKVFLIELSGSGLVCKETIKMKGRQYGVVRGMFIKGKYLVITTDEYFEVHEIIP